ncbi:hypothetical protein ACFW93_48465 [Streptomyces canus]|uniref:hypothetical protein n=1 Tax=Streptomyces canus TaxID=58343 RepID=UPI00369B1207
MSGDVEDWFLIGVAVLTLVGELAEERPVLIIADEAQWLDEPSAVNIRLLLEALDLQTDITS